MGGAGGAHRIPRRQLEPTELTQGDRGAGDKGLQASEERRH